MTNAGTGPGDDYALLDSGHGRKLERFGPHVLARPCAQALWAPQAGPDAWDQAAATFTRDEGGHWERRAPLPERWVIRTAGLRFRLACTDFGHLGLFPEQRDLWRWLTAVLTRAPRPAGRPLQVLNLFAYSGGATLAAARAGAEVCHVDAAKGMVEWARENAALNDLAAAPIRWLVDDVGAFLARETRRGRRYDAIVLDPPSYGRGGGKGKGKVFKLEDDLPAILAAGGQLLAPTPVFVLLTAHTPLITPLGLANCLRALRPGAPAAEFAAGEMRLGGTAGVFPVPSGSYACWRAAGLPAPEPASL